MVIIRPPVLMMQLSESWLFPDGFHGLRKLDQSWKDERMY
jgi:hypothetical protein